MLSFSRSKTQRKTCARLGEIYHEILLSLPEEFGFKKEFEKINLIMIWL
ncbi:hypothetical protein [Campylobacter geochelonis]|nr:hypothetical protein [Campylobacter geochelonis]